MNPSLEELPARKEMADCCGFKSADAMRPTSLRVLASPQANTPVASEAHSYARQSHRL
jgi:hypothetical protein